jgi:hypothetical protein
MLNYSQTSVPCVNSSNGCQNIVLCRGWVRGGGVGSYCVGVDFVNYSKCDTRKLGKHCENYPKHDTRKMGKIHVNYPKCDTREMGKNGENYPKYNTREMGKNSNKLPKMRHT